MPMFNYLFFKKFKKNLNELLIQIFGYKFVQDEVSG
jgi:hypothetical protein